MYDFKLGSSGNTIQIGIGDTASGLGTTGLTNSSCTFKLKKPGVAAAAKTFTGPEWVEIGNGWYEATILAGDVDTLGMCGLVVIPPGGGPEGDYPYQVVANITSDVFTRLGAPVGASVSADVAALKVVVDAIKVVVDAITLKTANLPSDPADHSLIIDATNAILTAVGGKASQLSVDLMAGEVTSVLSALRKLAPFVRSRSAVQSRDPSTGAPLTTQIYVWDTDVNFAANGATGRQEYLATTTYHASGHIISHVVAPV